jgi:hypothetical protein
MYDFLGVWLCDCMQINLFWSSELVRHFMHEGVHASCTRFDCVFASFTLKPQLLFIDGGLIQNPDENNNGRRACTHMQEDHDHTHARVYAISHQTFARILAYISMISRSGSTYLCQKWQP